VPARVAGRWRMQNGELEFEQQFQMLTGHFIFDGHTAAISEGRLRGDRLTFRIGAKEFSGRVDGAVIVGRGWTATRMP